MIPANGLNNIETFGSHDDDSGYDNATNCTNTNTTANTTATFNGRINTADELIHNCNNSGFSSPVTNRSSPYGVRLNGNGRAGSSSLLARADAMMGSNGGPGGGGGLGSCGSDASTASQMAVGDDSAESSCEDPNAPLNHDFNVSFLVDARGGYMHGCRYGGVRVTLPPRTASQPMRITCRYVKTENLLYPPTLNEGEGLASRILQMGPVGADFLGPVLLEVPHVASLRHGERETAILRCDSASKGKWVEHKHDISEKLLKDALTLSGSQPPQPHTTDSVSISESISLAMSSPAKQNYKNKLKAKQNEESNNVPSKPNQMVQIATTDFPQYFAVITRPRQDIKTVGCDGQVLSSVLVPRARIHVPPKALTKEIEIGISAYKIEDDVVAEIMVQGGAVSPIITVEPRRRKFHRPIQVTMPLPERKMLPESSKPAGNTSSEGSLSGESRKPSVESLANGKANNKVIRSLATPSTPMVVPDQIETSLKLLCSMSANGSRACWEDVTNNTPLTFANGCVQFTSIVSASFWLINCPNWMSLDAMVLTDQLYKGNLRVPYLGKFFIFARRLNAEEVTVRVICLTEPDRLEHILELQEDFKEICRSEFVEIVDKSEVGVKFGGNLEKNENEDRKLRFRPFYENRATFTVKRKVAKNPYPKGKIVLTNFLGQHLFDAKVDFTQFKNNK